MAAERLIWVGLICCLGALGIQMFPNLAFRAGVDLDASWRVFGFGVFLIIASVAASAAGGRRR